MKPTQVVPTSLGMQRSLTSEQVGSIAFSVTNTTAPAGSTPLVLPANFPVALDAEQQNAIVQRLQAFSVYSLSLQDVATIGVSAEQALMHALDGFLARIDSQNAGAIFKLITNLNEQIGSEKLPELADQILNARPSLLAKAMGLFSPKSLRAASAKVYEDLERVMGGKTQSLVNTLNQMEARLRVEMQGLQHQLHDMELVKDAYRDAFVDFAIETVFLTGACAKARQEYAAAEATLLADSVRHLDTKDKLEALESRALAVEGTMSRLPADQLAIRQQQRTGLSTLQELNTTLAGRFASIKMTLIKLNGSLSIRNVQRLSEEGAALDANLDRVNAKLMNDVVKTAAIAPGANRIEQAKQLQGIVSSTRELVEFVEAARVTNAQQMEEARTMMAQSRLEMLTLSKTLDPRVTVPGRAN